MPHVVGASFSLRFVPTVYRMADVEREGKLQLVLRHVSIVFSCKYFCVCMSQSYLNCLTWFRTTREKARASLACVLCVAALTTRGHFRAEVWAAELSSCGVFF